MPKYGNKPVPVSNDLLDLENEDNISRLQIAVLAESTDRSTSKPKSIIAGQQSTGGGGGTNPHTLTANVDNGSGPFLSNGVENLTIFSDLYDAVGAAKFDGTTINGVPIAASGSISAKDMFLYATVGESYQLTTNTICLYIPNVDDGSLGAASAAGRYTYSQAITYQAGTGFIPGMPPTFPKPALSSDKWLIPENLMVLMNDLDPTTDSIADITINMMNTTSQYLKDALGPTTTVKPRDFVWTLAKTPTIVGNATSPGLLDHTDPSKWWVKVKDALPILATAPVGRVANSADCVDDPTKRGDGYMVSQDTSTFHETPLKITTGPVTVTGTILDPDTVSARPPQFQLDIAFDQTIFSNILAVVFANAAYDDELDGKVFKVEVLRDAVTKDQSGGGPPAIEVYMDGRAEQLITDPTDPTQQIPDSNQFEEESIIPAINRIHEKTHLAKGQAVSLNQFLTNQVIGNPNLSQVDSESAIYKALSAAGYDPGSQFANDRLNLIPILSGDRLVEPRFLYDNDGNLILDDLGVPKISTITQEERDGMTEAYRRELGLKHPRSNKPPTTMIEALWTSWRHLSALTTDTYGISALTDVDIIKDKHELLEPMKLNSFIHNFNLLYNRTSSLSADLKPIKRALSGEAPGDTLIEQLSSHSIYHNLNTLYTGVSANSACCEINSLSATSNRTDITNLSAFAVELEKRIGTGGGVSTCEGEDICSALTNLHDTIVNLNNPGGFVLCYPANGIEKHFKPDLAWQDTVDCSDTVMPDSDVYRYYEDVSGGVDVVLYLWQEKATNDWHVSSGDIDGKFQCSTAFSIAITNPDNKPLDELTLNGCDIISQPSPYPEFTEKINKVIEYVSNPPVIRNPGGAGKDPVDVDALSACCDTNTLNLSALSSYVFGNPPISLAAAIKKPTGLDPNGLTDVVNILFQRILTLEEFGGGDGDPQTVINQLNINVLSGDLTSLSGDVIDLTDIVNNNVINVNNVITDIDVLSGTITDLEECCDQSLKLDDISNHAVLLTGSQSVSGEKIFKETLTVDTSAVIGENITVGSGDTVFSVCPDEAAGVSYVQIHDIITISTSDPATSLPAGAIYAMDVTGSDGIIRKQLFIK